MISPGAFLPEVKTNGTKYFILLNHKGNMSDKDFYRYNSDYKLPKDWVFPYSQVPKGANVILYGAGDVGQAYYAQNTVTEYCNILAWVDKAYMTYAEYGFKVTDPKKINYSVCDKVIIAVCDMKIAVMINEYLHELGCTQEKIVWNYDERYTYRNSVYENRIVRAAYYTYKRYLDRIGIKENSIEYSSCIERLENELKKKDKLVIPRVVLELTTACTLKCKYCNNLMNLYGRPRHIELNTLKNAVDALTEAVDKVIILEMIGGEPFLYPELKEILQYVINKEKILSVEVTTNGTMIPKEEVLKILSNEKVTLRISVYPNSDKAEELKKVLENNKVRYEALDELVWTDSGNTEKRNRTENELRNRYWNCGPSYECKTILDEKLFSCARAASLYDLGIGRDEIGFVDLSDQTDLKQKIRDFMLRSFDYACDYCNLTDRWRRVDAGG